MEEEWRVRVVHHPWPAQKRLLRVRLHHVRPTVLSPELTEPPGGGGPCRRSTGFQGVIDTSRTADTSLAHEA